MPQEALQCTVERPMTRLEKKEACRLAYVSGRATLRELEDLHELPYGTLKRWSVEEQWGEAQSAVRTQAETNLVPKIADWVSKQHEVQVRRGLERGLAIQNDVDEVRKRGSVVVMTQAGPVDIPFGPKDVQAIAMAEDKADLVIRRNLGMENQAAGPTLNLNVLGTINIGE